MFTLSVVRAQRCEKTLTDFASIQKQKGHSHDLLPFDELFKVF